VALGVIDGGALMAAGLWWLSMRLIKQ